MLIGEKILTPEEKLIESVFAFAEYGKVPIKDKSNDVKRKSKNVFLFISTT
jgi:hypothetical protein